MIIEPKIRGFICTTAHPEGCGQAVGRQMEYVKANGPVGGLKNVLVIGGSTGYGLASRIVSAFGCGAKTINVSLERRAEKSRTATAGWYNTAAFEKLSRAEGIYARSVIGDAFSDEVKRRTIEIIKKDLGKIDLVIYSLASPVRIHPRTGIRHQSVIKPIGSPFTSKTIDINKLKLSEVTLQPADEDEIRDTVAVMGGEDWKLWIDNLSKSGCLSEGALTVAYSYIGPKLTHSIYRDGTIGMAKKDLEQKAEMINREYNGKVRAVISVNKALVTQASSAIPVVPLYISILYKIMKQESKHEGCIEQIYRMFGKIYDSDGIQLDGGGYIRMDDWEMEESIQRQVAEHWQRINDDNIGEYADTEGYIKDFYNLFGFGLEGIDYNRETDPFVEIEDAVII